MLLMITVGFCILHDVLYDMGIMKPPLVLFILAVSVIIFKTMVCYGSVNMCHNIGINKLN